MKATEFSPALLLLVTSLLLMGGCGEKEELQLSELPPLLGFGEEKGILDVTGADTLEVNVLWTTATTEERQLPFELSGTGVGPEDLLVLTPSPLSVPAGATETTIRLLTAPAADSTRVERGGTIVLQPADWFRLTERDSFSFNFAVPNTVDLSIWVPTDPFPQLWGYTSFGPEPVPEGTGLGAGQHFAFAYSSTTEPNVIGMYNTAEGRSTNALNLHRVYADFEVTSASANIRIPRLFRLTPAAEGATRGTVEVIEQRVRITRRSSSGLPPFTVGISGSGTYDETTGIIAVAVIFDESELGITEPVVRRYTYERERRQ